MEVRGLDLTMNIDEAPWRDLDGATPAVLRRVAGLPKGTKQGRASIGLAIQTESGDWVIAQTTLRLFVNAARALAARYEDDLRD